MTENKTIILVDIWSLTMLTNKYTAYCRCKARSLKKKWHKFSVITVKQSRKTKRSSSTNAVPNKIKSRFRFDAERGVHTYNDVTENLTF